MPTDKLVDLGSFRLTPTGLVIVGDPTFEECQRVGDWLHSVESGMQWMIGDWMAFVDHRYGERAAVASERLQTWMNYGWVARRFPSSRRREALSWTHHEIVAALEPADQDRLLEDAMRERWSTRELRRRVKALTERPPANAPTLPFPDMPEQPTRETLGKRTDPHRQPRRRHIRWKLKVIEESFVRELLNWLETPHERQAQCETCARLLALSQTVDLGVLAVKLRVDDHDEDDGDDNDSGRGTN